MKYLEPQILSSFKGYKYSQFSKDLISGLIVGVVAWPLSLAFDIASGVSPEKGIITAIIVGLIISCLGGSKVQLGGPTAAFIVIVYGIIQQYGETGLTIASLSGAILLIRLVLFKLSSLI